LNSSLIQTAFYAQYLSRPFSLLPKLLTYGLLAFINLMQKTFNC
jgi:hypothetical protein